jgi:hypothetical protein
LPKIVDRSTLTVFAGIRHPEVSFSLMRRGIAPKYGEHHPVGLPGAAPAATVAAFGTRFRAALQRAKRRLGKRREFGLSQALG